MNISKSSLRFAGIIAFSGLILFSSCNNNKQNTNNTEKKKEVVPSGTSAGDVKVSIAYINLDTLEEKYTSFKEAKKQFEQRQASMEASLKTAAQNFENEYINFQKKAQAGTLTQAEGEATQKKLQQMQMDLEKRRDNLSQQLLKEQDDFAKGLQNQLDSFLNEYNKDKHYDYIFSHVKGGGILLANPDFDITNDVLEKMNKMYQEQKSAKATK